MLTEHELTFPPLLHTFYIRDYQLAHYVEMSSRGVVSGKEASNSPGLHSVKGQ